MEIRLSDLLGNQKAINETDEKKLREEEDLRNLARYEKIIKGVSGKYGKTWCLNYDEVYSELVCKLLTLARKHGWENLNENLVARICYNKAVSVYRSARRRWDKQVQEMDLREAEMNPSEIKKIESSIGNTDDQYLTILYSQFLDMYDPDSRERTFLIIKFVSEGILPEEYSEEIGIEIPHLGLRDYEISTLLGLSPKSSSFRLMKDRIREELKEFLKELD